MSRKGKRFKFAFSGCKFSGKDTLVNSLADEHHILVYSFSDPLKVICKNLFPFMKFDYPSNEKEQPIYTNPVTGVQYSPRDIWTKMNVMVDIYPNILVEKMATVYKEDLEIFKESTQDIILIIKDLRPHNPLELKFCKDHGFKIIYIENIVDPVQNPTDVTEQGYDFILSQSDYVYRNNKNGTEEFQRIFNQILKEQK